MKSFVRRIRRKLSDRNDESLEWPLSPEKLVALLHKAPLPELYNAIYYTLYDTAKKNTYGYNITSSTARATRIWSLASDWEYLETNNLSPKQAVTDLVLHRISSKLKNKTHEILSQFLYV